jgi:hypothetical protein
MTSLQNLPKGHGKKILNIIAINYVHYQVIKRKMTSITIEKLVISEMVHGQTVK